MQSATREPFPSLSFLSQLNPQQREAVETTEGPVLILAGSGSGKTRVITYRIAYLIERVGVMPESILAMTFTNKAAAEMGERVEKLVGGLSVAKPVISTFHSFCVRLLRRDIEALRILSSVPGQPAIGHTKSFVIYDESDQQQVTKSIMKRLGIDDKQLTPRAVLAHISWAKNHMLDPQEVYLNSADPKTERIAHIYEEYRKELRRANAFDFDDLLLEAVRLLKSAASVREYYNLRFQYILIDEYQDTNRPQYELMRLLAGSRHNVCAVGDEDQSIYSWRGADIRNILEFEKDFPEAKIIRLEQNYRSTQNILQAASAVVANNVRRKGKNLWTSRQGGPRIGYYEAPDGEATRRQRLPQRALAALRSFKAVIEDGQAMLAGTYTERLEETALEEEPSEAPAAIELDDQISFDPAEFGSAGVSPAQQRAGRPPDSRQDAGATVEVLGANTAEILKFLIDRTGYIKQLEEEDTPEAYSRVENLRELVNAAMDSRDRGETLDQFLDHAALVSDADAYDERAQITLMTLHAAKGLEFPLVFLCGLEEGLFPHSRTFLHPDDIEEERRLCYVGMTRAMDALILTRAVYRRRYGTDLPEASVPSRFLEEVPAELMENLGTPRRARVSAGDSPARATAVHGERESGHYAYEDEDQSVSWGGRNHRRSQTPSYSGKTYNSIDNIAEFFASRGKKFSMSRLPVEEPKGRRGFRPGQKVKHPKYGEGTVYQREGEGEEAKITVQFPRFGLKKLVEKYAQLERA